MSGQITYAKVDGPPDDWYGLRIFNRKNGREITHVREVDAAEGWLIRERTNKRGEVFLRGDRIATQRLRGLFEIRRPAE